jgi:hypothetical protein
MERDQSFWISSSEHQGTMPKRIFSFILFYLLKCKKIKLPHWSGTKDFFQKKDERKKHNLADNI